MALLPSDFQEEELKFYSGSALTASNISPNGAGYITVPVPSGASEILDIIPKGVGANASWDGLTGFAFLYTENTSTKHEIWFRPIGGNTLQAQKYRVYYSLIYK